MCTTTSCRKLKKQLPHCLQRQQARRHTSRGHCRGCLSENGPVLTSFLKRNTNINAQTVPSLVPRKANKERIPCYSHQILNRDVKELCKSQGMTHDKNVFLSCLSKIIKNKFVAVIMVLSWTFKDKH